MNTPRLKIVATAIVLALAPPFASHGQIGQIKIQNTKPGTMKQAPSLDTSFFLLPGALGFEHYTGSVVQRRILGVFGTNGDYEPASTDHAISSDGGWTFGTTQDNPIIGGRALIKKRNTGALLTYNFLWDSQPTSHSFNFTYYRSTNAGSTWTSQTALVDFGANNCNSMHFHRDLLEENDGSLYAIGYANFTAAPGWRVVMIKSTNDGANWSYLSTIAYSSIRDYTESTFARCANGSWIAVMKTTFTSDGSNDVLRYRRSTDKGVTWIGTADPLPGMTTHHGVDPVLGLMPNGVLVLSYGPDSATAGASRDLKLAFSADGNGTAWSSLTTVHTSTKWNPGDAITSTIYEASGYTAVPSVGAHRILHLSDTGHSWSYNETVPSPNPFTIRGRFVDVVRTNEINRIDLKTKLALGAITVTTDLTYTDANNQESRSSGAVDGSTDYWSGAFKSATTGSYTIDLTNTYKINKIGVCLKYNTSESATVEISTNGSTWTTVKTYTNATHRALDYFAVTPTNARYVRVSITGGTSPVSLNEIEVYSTTDSFENNAAESDTAVVHGVIPPGYVSAGTSATQYGFAVRDASPNDGYQSVRSLQMYDGSSTWQAGLQKTTTATQAKTWEFRIKPQAYASGGAIYADILGTVTSGTNVIFYMRVNNDGSFQFNNGSGFANVTGCGAGTVPTNSWTLIKVVASNSTDNAGIYINGTFKANITMYANPANVTALNGFVWGSSGTVPFGDKALFDDIYFE